MYCESPAVAVNAEGTPLGPVNQRLTHARCAPRLSRGASIMPSRQTRSAEHGPDGFQNLRIRHGIAERIVLIERPDDSFRFWIELDHQRLARAGVAVADDIVAVRQDLERRHP